MDGTFLGKIESVRFGSWDEKIGFHFTLRSTGGNVCDSWGCTSLEYTKYCNWTEADRINILGQAVMRVNALLVKAKKNNLDQLKDVPIEVTFEGNMLKSWRILEEVI